MADDPNWLLLSLQLPAGPAYPRVRLWRRLREAGAVSIHGGVHALPERSDHLALFQRLADEVREQGGQALVFNALALDGDAAMLKAEFNAARQEDLSQWMREADRLLARQPSAAELARTQRRLQRIEEIDFFGSCADAARAILEELRVAASRHPDVRNDGPGITFRAPQLHGRVWVTRRNIGVDRIASAWLISRFIDPRPRFRFVDARRYTHDRRELRFDMAGGEFTHEGDLCSFETLLVRGGVAANAGLSALGEIIHQLDLADGKFDRPEAGELSAALDDICARWPKDLDRLRPASAILDVLYERLAEA